MKRFLKFGLCLVAALSCWSAPAQTNQYLLLADVDGFDDDELYPLGNLQPVNDGGAIWQPAGTTPGLITNVSGANGIVLRRRLTGVDNIDYLRFPAVSNGTLTVAFDARASTNFSRTLDVFILPTSGNETAQLGLATVTNKVAYYNGTAWIAVANLDTNWHRYEMIDYLAGTNFGKWDLKMDGVLIGTNLPWRNNYPAGTPYSRVRFGGIRGTNGTFADIDNIVISAVVPYTPPDILSLTNPAGSTGQFAFSFQSKTNTEYLVETTTSVAGVRTNDWAPLAIVSGTGQLKRFTNAPATNLAELYRLKQLPARW